MSDDETVSDGARNTKLPPRHEVDPKLLEMLACPLTKAPLSWNAKKAELISRGARLAYPVRDGVPIMLPSEARPLDEEELNR